MTDYHDNDTLAFPILRSHSVPGVFFFVSSYVGGSYVPWWEEIGYLAYGGLNRDQTKSTFDMKRCAVDPFSAELFRLRTTVTSLMGKNLFYPR